MMKYGKEPATPFLRVVEQLLQQLALPVSVSSHSHTLYFCNYKFKGKGFGLFYYLFVFNQYNVMNQKPGS